MKNSKLTIGTFFKKSISSSIFLGLLALFAIACSSQSTAPPILETAASSNRATGILILGDISDEPARNIEVYQPFADYLAAQLQDVGIGVGEVKIAPDMETMAKWLASGKVDLYFDSPYPATIVSQLADTRPILRRWKKGVETYNSIIFTRADRNLKTLEDLQGKTIAFEEPFSTSGYMLPLAHLTELGFQLVEKDETNTRKIGRLIASSL